MRPPACTPTPPARRLPLRRAGPAARPSPGRPAAGHDPALLPRLDPDRDRWAAGRGSRHGAPLGPPLQHPRHPGPVRRSRAGRPRVGSPGWAGASWGCRPNPAPGPSAGCGWPWAAPPSASAPCTAASVRWRPGGGPGWSPAATPTATRPWPPCARPSPSCPPARSCWPKTRRISTCCPGCGRPGFLIGSAWRS
jgi:hypothetical protein